jgi:C4-dicarboxylate-specific signal transduction histidine kinase
LRPAQFPGAPEPLAAHILIGINSIVVAAWCGGAGPGFLAALLATLVLPLLLTMNYPLSAGFFDLPRFMAFGITGLAVGWGTTFRRRAEAALRRSARELRKARNELEMTVLERTAALRRSEALLAEAQTLSQTGSFGWKVATGESLWSEETFRIFRYDRTTKPTMERALQRVHPKDVALVQQTIACASQDGKDFEQECRLLLPDGAVKYVHIVTHAVSDEAGSLELVGAVMDVTERKQAEEALRKVQAELAHVARLTTLGELTASIAHEINQPLASVVNSANACVRWLAAQNLEKARQSALRVVADGHRAGEIITRIRALAKKAPPQKDWLDINATIRDVIALARSEVHRHGVVLEMHLAEHVPLVLADRIQLQQVLLNLIINAIEAMSGVGDGPRELVARSDTNASQGVLVTVRDSGPGLDLQRVSTGCSRPSIRPSHTAWAWGWRSAARLSPRTAAGCGRQRRRPTAPSCSSRCRVGARGWDDGRRGSGLRRR